MNDSYQAAVHAVITRGIRFESNKREREIRRDLIAAVRHAIQNVDMGKRADLPTLMAEAAVDAVADFYRCAAISANSGQIRTVRRFDRV